jgi:hypothetical protein
MKKSRFSEEQVIGILKQHEAGVKTAGLCREHVNCKRPSNTPVRGLVFVMNSGHECGRWSVGWSS